MRARLPPPDRTSAAWAAGYQEALHDMEHAECPGVWVRAMLHHHDDLADRLTVWAPSAHERATIAEALQLLADKVLA